MTATPNGHPPEQPPALNGASKLAQPQPLDGPLDGPIPVPAPAPAPAPPETSEHLTDSSEEPNPSASASASAIDPDSLPHTLSPPTLPVPTNSQLLEAILPIRSDAPTLGLPKLLLRLKALNPGWQLSEKRLRKFLNTNPNLSPQTSNHDQTRSFPRPPSEPLWLPDYSWEKDWEAASIDNSPAEPLSSLDDILLLECRQRSVKVEPVRFPESNKGSGLIAKDFYPKGTQLIKEDALVWVPHNKNVSRSVMSGQHCAFCGRAFSMQRTKSQPSCPHHPAPGSKEAIAAQQLVTTTSTTSTGSQSVTEKPGGPEPCYMRYCTRVCVQRSIDYYGPLVCPQRNPEYMQVIRLADAEEFRGAHLVFKMFARMLIANENGDISTNPAFQPSQPSENGVKKDAPIPSTDAEQDLTGSDDPAQVGGRNSKNKKAKAKKNNPTSVRPEWSAPSVEFEKLTKRVESLATVSDRARRERFQGGGHLGSHFTDVRYGPLWRNAWQVVIRALHLDTGYRPPPEPSATRDVFWATFWKRRLAPDTIAHYFGFRSFLEFAGRMSLNREADHGLYLLHARFNHSCEPNATVLKHPGSEEAHKSAPSTIYVIAKRDIQKDEEITLTYINPELPLEARRKKLYEEYLFSCFCNRCRRELKEEEERKVEEAEKTRLMMMNGGGAEAIQEIGSEEVQIQPTTTGEEENQTTTNGNHHHPIVVNNGKNKDDECLADERQSIVLFF